MLCVPLVYLFSNHSNMPVFKNSIISCVHLARTPFSNSVYKTRNVWKLPTKPNFDARNNCTTRDTDPTTGRLILWTVEMDVELELSNWNVLLWVNDTEQKSASHYLNSLFIYFFLLFVFLHFYVYVEPKIESLRL